MTATAAEPALPPVPGLRLGAVAAGIRYPERLDLVALQLAPGSRVAAVFTRNAFCAAPVRVARRHLAACGGAARLLLINTGNANAGTGEVGLRAALDCCTAAGAAAGLPAETVLPFSTGVIGEDLPLSPIRAALPSLLARLRPDGWSEAARGILTTDTRPKMAWREVRDGERRYRLAGIAKGAGMLRPDLATMLAFLASDAPLAQPLLETLLRRAVESSFHRITIDGDTSTNDAVVLAASGDATPLENDPASPLARAFGAALESLCLELAQALVRDGEGATKFVEIAVRGGASARECLDVAFTIAHSPLVKTALFAGDANWGRVLAAIGRAGLAELDVAAVRIAVNDTLIAEGGARAASYSEEAGARAMAAPELRLAIDLGRGTARETVWTSDFSHDYVRINAEYRS